MSWQTEDDNYVYLMADLSQGADCNNDHNLVVARRRGGKTSAQGSLGHCDLKQ
jgi:hypothetical protein